MIQCVELSTQPAGRGCLLLVSHYRKCRSLSNLTTESESCWFPPDPQCLASTYLAQGQIVLNGGRDVATVISLCWISPERLSSAAGCALQAPGAPGAPGLTASSLSTFPAVVRGPLPPSVGPEDL